ncbi:MAG: carbamoyltransferase HypF, partial [Candidatus Hydrogenedentes bacterium]|nr:carbamoyltransferase HypF [Candidatus Hydrogenedentota bacterium]
EAMVLRRARGYAPLPLSASTVSEDVLAVGGHLKNSVAFSKGGTIFPSQHIGNLENVPAIDAFQKTIGSMRGLLEITPKRVIHDLHPDYASTRFALKQGLPTVAVQHHFAHVLSCMAEHNLEGPVLGISWDGTGYGPDGTIWGGEFLRCTCEDYARVARLRPFHLPGGDAAVRDPWRSALSLLHEVWEEPVELLDGLPTLAAVAQRERDTITTMLTKGINAPWTSSMGRLFDGVASLCGCCQRSTFEGQAAMTLERVALRYRPDGFPLTLDVDGHDDLLSLNWERMIVRVVEAVLDGIPTGAIAKGFHAALVAAIVQVAEAACLDDIVLTGGCFQNQLLLEESLAALKKSGFRVYRHHVIPPNDGGIAVGQAWFKTGENCHE